MGLRSRLAKVLPVKQIGRRWAGLTDQVFYSAVSLLQIVLLSRILPKEEFGYFAIAIGISLFFQGIQRSAVIIPVIVLFPTTALYANSGRWQKVHFALVAATVAGLAAGSFAARALGYEEVAKIMLVAAPVTATTMLYDYQRRGLYTLMKEKAVVASSLVFLVANLAAVAGVWLFDVRTAAVALLCAGAAGALAAAFAFVMKGPVASTRNAAGKSAAEIRRIVIWNLLSFFPYSVYNNGMVLIVGAVGGPLHAAVFGATRIFAAPIQLLINAIDNTDKPRAARALMEGGVPAFRQSLRNSALTLLVLGAPYLAIVAIDPQLIGRIVLGPEYANSLWLGRLWALVALFMLLGQPIETGLITLARSHLLLVGRLAVAVIAVITLVALKSVFPEASSVAALAAGWLFATIFGAGSLWYCLSRFQPHGGRS